LARLFYGQKFEKCGNNLSLLIICLKMRGKNEPNEKNAWPYDFNSGFGSDFPAIRGRSPASH
jgi:hypothetical protein